MKKRWHKDPSEGRYLTVAAVVLMLLLSACGNDDGGNLAGIDLENLELPESTTSDEVGDNEVATTGIGFGGGGSGSSGCGTVEDIGPSSTATGTLSTGDCLLSDLIINFPPDGTFVDEYRVSLSTAANLTVTMTSADFDAYLIVVDRSESCASGGCPLSSIIFFDDNGGGGPNGTNASLTMSLSSGTYLIFANSTVADQGSYRLETSF